MISRGALSDEQWLEKIVQVLASIDPCKISKDNDNECFFCEEYVGWLIDQQDIDRGSYPPEKLGQRQYDHRPDCLWKRAQQASQNMTQGKDD